MEFPLGKKEIFEYLPHRDPFLFVDEILSVTPGTDAEGNMCTMGTKVVGTKTFTMENDTFFQGHFPDYPIVPGVVLIEMMGQVGTFGYIPFMKNPSLAINSGNILTLAGVNKSRFRKPVLPNEKITIECVATKNRASLWGFTCTASVDGKLVAECDLLANYDLKRNLKDG